MKNFQKNVNFKKMMKVFKKNQRKIFFEKNFRIFFSPKILQNIILTKNIHKWTKKVEISKQLIFFCKRAQKIMAASFSEFHRILVTIKLNLMFHIFHGEKPKSNLMLPWSTVRWMFPCWKPRQHQICNQGRRIWQAKCNECSL